jgi:Tol biopolymer transport system component
MSLNAKKSIVIRIAPKNKQVRKTSYKLHGHTLDNVEASKYLGITININLSWDRHIDNIVGKRMDPKLLAYSTIGLTIAVYKGNNKITELRTILQRESQNS